MEWLAVLALSSWSAAFLWVGFSYLIAKDAEEVQRNKEEACGPHRWGRVAGGLRCAGCGKVPQGVGR